MAFLYLALGLAGLFVGSDLAVRGSVAVAHRMNWPTWVTGLLLLALGTSLPELFVSAASAVDHPGVAVGNIFGSNAFNALLVLGAVLLLKGNQKLDAHAVRLPTLVPLVFGSALAFTLLVMPVEAYRFSALFLLGYLVMILASIAGRDASAEDEVARAPGWGLPLAITATLGGFAVLAVAAKGFLVGALDVAATFGWSDGFVGYVLTAIGTSAPELFTSVRALRLGHAGAVFGNVVGSNAFNLLLVGGVVGLLADARVPQEGLQAQLWTNAFATAVLLVPALFATGGRRIPAQVYRLSGILLLLAYAVSAWWVHASSGPAA